MTNDEAIKILSVLHLGHSLKVKTACEMGIKALLNASKKGEWIEDSENYVLAYGCSVCGGRDDAPDNFCPCCGAEMREKEL